MEKEIIHIALERLRKVAGLEANWIENGPLDGMLDFMVNGQKFNYVVEVKGELRNHQLQNIEEQFNQNIDFMLFARHIFPKIKEELRKMEIPYLEANGNIYLKKKNIFLFIETQKPLQIEKNKGNRAFTKTGLKVLFYLLQNKEAINLTQRELAEHTKVGLGTIPQVIEGTDSEMNTRKLIISGGLEFEDDLRRCAETVGVSIEKLSECLQNKK